MEATWAAEQALGEVEEPSVLAMHSGLDPLSNRSATFL